LTLITLYASPPSSSFASTLVRIECYVI
jgi:hypothetical protein